MKTTYSALAVAIACTGCASVMNDSTHPIKVENRTGAGDAVVGAD